jgi:hypothetical protein
MVAPVSIDLCATVQEPISLATVLAAANTAMRELLHLESAPAIAVFAAPRYEQGRLVDPGLPCSVESLANDMIGGRMSAGHYDFRLANRADLARFFVVQDEGMVDAVFSPTRTCAGVVLATALSLAAADHGCGEFLDLEIRMIDPPVTEPSIFAQSTKLKEQGVDFELQCERYMRQFVRLDSLFRGGLA